MGPNGETILVAVNRGDRLVEQRMLAPGDGHVQATDELWSTLEREDPIPNLQII
jgi:hypothetical protein